MNISIDPRTLIDQAKYSSGLSFGDMAEELAIAPARISEWRSGKAAIGTDEIAYFADKAKLPIIETVIALKPQWTAVWKRAASQCHSS